MADLFPILRPGALPELRRYESDEDNLWGDGVLEMWVRSYPEEAVAEILRLRAMLDK